MTVLVRAKKDHAPLKVTYTPEQLERMKLARRVWEKKRSMADVARALGVSHERARQIFDRGSALGLYPKRRGSDASTIHPEPRKAPRDRSLARLMSDEILRLARRAARPLVAELRRDLARQRRLVASLRGEVSGLSRDRLLLMEDLRKRLAQPAPAAPDALRRVRLGPKLILAQRRRLGLNKTEFARLLGFSAMMVTKWEAGTKPRLRARAALVAVRQLGRREARQRLAALGLPASRRKARF
jgi:DNA-binding transcriptional regulator YiaG